MSKDYEQWLIDNPDCKKTLDGIAERFANGKKSACDECKTNEIAIGRFHVYMTPDKPHRVLLICDPCLHKFSLKHNLNIPGAHTLN